MSKRLWIVVLGAALILLSGCGQKMTGSQAAVQTAAPVTQSPGPTETVLPTTLLPTVISTLPPTPQPSKSNPTGQPSIVHTGKLVYVPSGTKFDFDRDGKIETLSYNSPNESTMKLTMKDGAGSYQWNISCQNPSQKVYIGDINTKDNRYDLFIDEFGASDDYAVYIAGVLPGKFLPRGLIPGTLQGLKVPGNGVISTTKRMNILMTWFTEVEYRLNATSGKIQFVPQAFYNMNSFKCKTKVALPLLASSDINDQQTAFVVPTGKQVTLLKTDDKKWIFIKYGKECGWLLMADLYSLMDPNISGAEAFDGLVFAD